MPRRLGSAISGEDAMNEKTEYQPNLPIGMLTERDLDAYERIGWHAWADGIRHENCPYRDGRQMPWQFGWCAAEQNYRRAVQNYRKAVLDARTDQSPAPSMSDSPLRINGMPV